MTQLDLKSRLGTIVSECETKLRELILQAAHSVESKTHEIEVSLEGDVKAVVNRITGSITAGGQAVKNLLHLQQIADGIHKALGVAADVKEDVASDASNVEKGVENATHDLSEVPGLVKDASEGKLA